MQLIANRPEAPSAIRSDLGAIFVSNGTQSLKLGDHLAVAGQRRERNVEAWCFPATGDICALLTRFSSLKQKAFARTGEIVPDRGHFQEAGLDGFWIHRALEKEGIESHVVDRLPRSQPHVGAGEPRLIGSTAKALLRALLAYKRGEPRVCAMVRAPTPQEEDRRRVCRERKVLIAERINHVNRIKGLLFCQGVSGYEPLGVAIVSAAARRTLKTGDGRPCRTILRSRSAVNLTGSNCLLGQIKAVEAERDALLDAQQIVATSPAAMLLEFNGIGPEFAAVLWSEGLFRHFDNRRQVASYAGLAPTPWQSGSIDREQGVSKSGNPRLRTTLIQLAWLWLRHQPQSAHGSVVRRTGQAQWRSS